MMSEHFEGIVPAITPENYLELAKELSDRPTPASLRSAGDRAYYAAFLFCRDELARKGYITPFYDHNDHQYISRFLDKLLGQRNNDEYRLRINRNRITYVTSELKDISIPLMVTRAKKIIDRIKALPPKTQQGLRNN